jgi:hypothetical protein
MPPFDVPEVRMSRLALAAAAVMAAAVLVPAVAGDDPPPLKFAWPVPSKGRVTETILKGGRTFKTRCTANLEKTEDRSALRLHYSDWEIVEIEGRGADDPATAAQVRMLLVSLKVTPDLVIGANGEVKEVVGLDRQVATILGEIEKGADEALKARLPKLREQLDSPEARAAMERSVTRAWKTWVGDWAGRAIPEGERGIEEPYKIPCPDMAEYDAPTRFRRMSGEKEGAGLVRFLRESVLDGEDARPILAALMRKMKEAAGDAPPATGLRLVDRSMAVADPATLLPKRVLREQLLTLQLKDMPERTDVERHEYTFEWEPSPAPAAGDAPK